MSIHWFGTRGRAIVPVLFLLVVAIAAVKEDPEDWANSPQAYFLTSEERAEWKKLDSRDSRAAFQERYWLKRDPSPGSEKNEFREMVLARIKTADSRFSIEKTPGSRTARGLVFIVLGTPARITNENAPRPAPDPAAGRRLGEGFTPVALNEGNETTSTWYYETDRSPRILELLARPSITIKIVVEPSLHKDAIQDPGLFNQLRETVAHKSIVNPDLIPPSRSASAVPELSLPRRTLSMAARKILESAPGAVRTENAFVGSAVLFPDSGDAETVFWIYSSGTSAPAFFHVLVRAPDGTEVVGLTEPAATAASFSTLAPGIVTFRRLKLSPGSYSAALALTDAAGGILAAAELPVQVPSLGKDFAVSSLLITRAPAPASKTSESLFTFSGAFLPPRADASFSRSESLWYFFEVANPSDPARVMIEPRLRHGTEPFAGLPAFPAKLSPAGSGRYLSGIEMPLTSLEPGNYVLYVNVRDGDREPSVLRRADFRVNR